MITFGTLFLNFCLYELQELNCYKHVFENYLQVFELDLKILMIQKIKFKYLKIGELFLQDK
jgi:hypothetical protein